MLVVSLSLSARSPGRTSNVDPQSFFWNRFLSFNLSPAVPSIVRVSSANRRVPTCNVRVFCFIFKSSLYVSFGLVSSPCTLCTVPARSSFARWSMGSFLVDFVRHRNDCHICLAAHLQATSLTPSLPHSHSVRLHCSFRKSEVEPISQLVFQPYRKSGFLR